MSETADPTPALEADCVIARHQHPIARHDEKPRFTVVTLVTDSDQYIAMRQSFRDAGFDDAETEYVAIDNRADAQFDAYAGLNRGLSAATGQDIIVCHQDIRLTHDGHGDLVDRLDELNVMHPTWGIAANAGGTQQATLALRITDPHGRDQKIGQFPEPVVSVDENFMVVRGGTRFGFSSDLAGFHLYGADLCLNARMAGHDAFVIDFHLTHLSAGTKDAAFRATEQAFVAKWCSAMAPRWIKTTCTLMKLDGGETYRTILNVLPPSLRRLDARFAARGLALRRKLGWGQPLRSER